MVTSVIVIINSVIIIINFRTIHVGLPHSWWFLPCGRASTSLLVSLCPFTHWPPRGEKNDIFILINLEGEIGNTQPAPFFTLPLGSEPVCKEHAQYVSRACPELLWPGMMTLFRLEAQWQELHQFPDINSMFCFIRNKDGPVFECPTAKSFVLLLNQFITGMKKRGAV